MGSRFNKRSPPTIPLNTKSWQKEMFSTLLNTHVQTSICCTISPWAFLTLLQALEIGASTLGTVRRATNLWWRGFIPQADTRFGASNSVAFTHLSWQRRPTSSSSSHPPNVGNDMKCHQNNWNWVAILKAKLESEKWRDSGRLRVLLLRHSNNSTQET